MKAVLEKVNSFLLKHLWGVVLVLILCILYKGQGVQLRPLPTPTPRIAEYKQAMAVSLDGQSDKIIASFTISIEARNTERTKSVLERRIKEARGTIENFNSHNNSYSFVVRVPAESVHEFLKNVERLGSVVNRGGNESNVVEQYYDNRVRLQNLKERKVRLQSIIKTTQNILEIEREIVSVQNEIDLLIRNNQQIDNNITYSKVYINIVPKIDNGWSFGYSWSNAINNLVLLLQWIVDLSLHVVVFFPIVAICWGGWRGGRWCIKRATRHKDV